MSHFEITSIFDISIESSLLFIFDYSMPTLQPDKINMYIRYTL